MYTQLEHDGKNCARCCAAKFKGGDERWKDTVSGEFWRKNIC